MKRILFSALLLSVFVFQGISQNDVVLNINHKLGEANFQMDTEAVNNLDHVFKVTRLEYYISEITLTHDGGLETKIDDLWVLANAANSTVVELGSHDITSIEKIKFYIGVDADHNHLDPSTFPTDHPLAPKNPSMHWGWTAGYRFVAYEGYGGAAFNQRFELHGLGDGNYYSTEVELNATADNNLVSIYLDADYTKGLKDISLNSGVISHGEVDEARTCVANFSRVFSEGSPTSSTIDFSNVNDFNVFPNPIIEGYTYVKLDLDKKGGKYDLSVTAINGKNIQLVRSISDGQKIDLNATSSGVYYVNLMKDGQIIITRKVMVK